MQDRASEREPLLPFQRRPDLRVTVLDFRDEECAVVKDPIRLKYFRLTPEQHALLELLMVPRSAEFLKQRLQRRFPSIHVEHREIQSLLQDLHEKGLVASNRAGQGLQLVFRRTDELRKRAIKSLINPMYIRLPGWDPNALLGWMVGYVGWLLHPAMVVVSLAFVVCCIVFASSHYDDIRRKLPQFTEFFSGSNLVYLWMTLSVTKLIHEFGHGLSCRRFGGECREMGIVFLVFSPTLFCNTSDSWTFESRWQRIAVGAAGMYAELVLASFAVIAWWNLPPGLLQNLCLDVFFVASISTLIFNANPLLKFDGYYILADFLEIPNLQARASQALQNAIAWGCFGIKVPRSPFSPKARMGLFVTYGVSAALYRWAILIGIMGFMYQLLRPYRLELMGFGIVAVSLSANFVQHSRRWYQIFAAPRKEAMSKLRVSIMLGILASIGGLAILVPVPWYLECPCYAQPLGGQAIYAVVPGLLDKIHVSPGERISKDAPLVELRNDELIDRIEILQPQLLAAKQKQVAARALGDDAGVVIAQERERAIVREMEEARDWLRQTILRAPSAGYVVEPPRREEPLILEENHRLSQWSGTPISQANIGAFIENQTHICTIAPSQQVEVVLMIDQADAKHVVAGKEVRLKLYGLPGDVISSFIDQLSERTVLTCPPELWTAFGGPLSAIEADDGTLRLERGMLQASSRIRLRADQLKCGFRGTARVIVDEYSLAGWLWRWITTELRFRL